MGMPITVEVVDDISKKDVQKIFDYFKSVDKRFSAYKKNSEINMINDKRLQIKDSSEEMRQIFELAEQTKKETNGYFDIHHNGKFDPSGIVKGWSIFNASKILWELGFKNFYIDAGSDIQVSGKNGKENWTVGIKNPFKQEEVIKVVTLEDKGIATSGNYIRGDHIYNPKSNKEISGVVSLTVIGPNVYEADRFATAAFAMDEEGINFIESLEGFEGYLVNEKGIATFTSGFEKYII